jgi:hypothetical protein
MGCNALLKWDMHWKRLIRPCVSSHKRICYREYRRWSQSKYNGSGNAGVLSRLLSAMIVTTRHVVALG